jgi:hypothetical protein
MLTHPPRGSDGHHGCCFSNQDGSWIIIFFAFGATLETAIWGSGRSALKIHGRHVVAHRDPVRRMRAERVARRRYHAATERSSQPRVQINEPTDSRNSRQILPLNFPFPVAIFCFRLRVPHTPPSFSSSRSYPPNERERFCTIRWHREGP